MKASISLFGVVVFAAAQFALADTTCYQKCADQNETTVAGCYALKDSAKALECVAQAQKTLDQCYQSCRKTSSIPLSQNSRR